MNKRDDINSSVKTRSFWSGFLDGATATSFLVCKPRPVYIKELSVVDAWEQVGNSMRIVIANEKIREEAQKTPARKKIRA